MLNTMLRTAKWAVRDQRQLIAKGLGEAGAFAIELMLPFYAGKEINKKFDVRKRRVVFVRDPALFEAVHKAPATQLNAGAAYAFLKPYFGDESVFVMEGSEHIPAKQSVMRLVKNQMEVSDDDLLFFQYSVKEIFKTGTYPVLQPLQYVLAAFLLRTVYSEQGSKMCDRIIKDAMGAAQNASGTLLLFPALLRMTRRFGVGLTIRRQRLALRQFILEQLEGTDLAQTWRAAPDADRAAIKQQVVDNLMTLMIAGFESTGTACAWLLYEIARNRDVQSDLRSEIFERLRGDPIEYLADDNSLLALAVSESLRLHPSIPFVIRECQADMQLGDVSVRKGDYVVLSIEEMHKRHFGDDGAEFRPSRLKDRGNFPRMATFGGGAKICPGRAIAVQQLRALTALILASFNLETARATDPRIVRNRVTASPRGGMVLRLERIT